jgi:hypothetical protein
MECVEAFDDSWIAVEDKRELLRVIKQGYETSMPWADHALMKSLVKERYDRVVREMSKEDYLAEKREASVDGLLDAIVPDQLELKTGVEKMVAEKDEDTTVESC